MNTSHWLPVFADYFQFLLLDDRETSDFAPIWTREALDHMVVVGDGALSLATLRNADLSVELIIGAEAPVVDVTAFDHAVATSIAVGSGRLILMGCTDYLPDAPRIATAPGTYQVLYLVSGIASVRAGTEPAEDSYTVYLWPGLPRETMVLRGWGI